MFDHTVLGFCIWDIPALVVLIATVVVFLLHRHKQKKREKEFEDELAEKLAQKSTEASKAAYPGR